MLGGQQHPWDCAWELQDLCVGAWLLLVAPKPGVRLGPLMVAVCSGASLPRQ